MSVLMYYDSTFSEAKRAINEHSNSTEALEKCKKLFQTCKTVNVSEMPEVMSNKWLESLLDSFVVSQKCVREHCVFNTYYNSKPDVVIFDKKALVKDDGLCLAIISDTGSVDMADDSESSSLSSLSSPSEALWFTVMEMKKKSGSAGEGQLYAEALNTASQLAVTCLLEKRQFTSVNIYCISTTENGDIIQGKVSLLVLDFKNSKSKLYRSYEWSPIQECLLHVLSRV